MTKKELIEALSNVPDDAQIYVKHTWDDAYGPSVRKYSSQKKGRSVDTIVFFPQIGDHVSTDYRTEIL